MKRLLAVTALTIVYGFATLFARVAGIVRHRGGRRRIIVNGTFHNPNWFFAHVEPLTRAGAGEVILVTDAVVAELPNLTYRCPPGWANRLFSRAGAKFLWTCRVAITHPADVHIGYHVFPSAVTALVAARLTGARAVYQVTSGPLELEGGGWHAENALLVALGRPSALVERCADYLTHCFDLVVVRGESAAAYVREHGHTGRIEIVTGSVSVPPELPPEREVDVIFVGRLTEYKRPDRLLDVLETVAGRHPSLRAVLVGDGPDRAALERRVADAGLSQNIEFLGQRSDVPDLLLTARVFVLTSRWEGVSIAMLEAMGAGLVPVVSDVGDLRDFARAGETGWVIPESDTAEFADRILTLLEDPALIARLSAAARALVLERAERGRVSERWGRILAEIVASR